MPSVGTPPKLWSSISSWADLPNTWEVMFQHDLLGSIESLLGDFINYFAHVLLMSWGYVRLNDLQVPNCQTNPHDFAIHGMTTSH